MQGLHPLSQVWGGVVNTTENYAGNDVITADISCPAKIAFWAHNLVPVWLVLLTNTSLSNQRHRMLQIAGVVHRRWLCSGGHFDRKMLSYLHRKSHNKDETVSRPSCLYNGTPYNQKDHPYWNSSVLPNILMAYCKNAVSPLLMHWRYWAIDMWCTCCLLWGIVTQL